MVGIPSDLRRGGKMTRYKHYWIQIRLITDMIRGYYVNVGVMIYEVGTGNIVSDIAPWAPEEAFTMDTQVKKAVSEANQAFWKAIAEFEDTGLPPLTTPNDGFGTLVREVSNRAGSRIQFGGFRGFDLSGSLEDQLRAIYVAQVE